MAKGTEAAECAARARLSVTSLVLCITAQFVGVMVRDPLEKNPSPAVWTRAELPTLCVAGGTPKG